MKFKALLLSLFLFIPVKTVANEKPMITSETAQSIAINGLTKYSLTYCEQREEGFNHKQADEIAFDEAYDFMSLSAYQYQLGIETVLYAGNMPLMIKAMEKMAKARCSEYF